MLALENLSHEVLLSLLLDEDFAHNVDVTLTPRSRLKNKRP
jgi:hypothetical protein